MNHNQMKVESNVYLHVKMYFFAEIMLIFVWSAIVSATLKCLMKFYNLTEDVCLIFLKLFSFYWKVCFSNVLMDNKTEAVLLSGSS